MEFEAPARVHFTSELSADRLGQLEELLFFNENQAQYRNVVVESIERFGEPRIRNDRGLLRVHTSRLGEVQTLFAVEHRLDAHRPVAVAVFARTATDTMTLLHIAVHRDFAATGPFANEMVTMKLVGGVAKSSARIKDIRKVEMLYGMAECATITITIRARHERRA
jgi:hypothetical protein